MLQRMRELAGIQAHAADGVIGSAFDFFFDDETWQLRYLVVDTGRWITSRKLLLAIESVVNCDNTAIRIKHPRFLIERSRYIDLARPESTSDENRLRRYYGAWPHWAPYSVGAGPHNLSSLLCKARADLQERRRIPAPSLHSGTELRQFRLDLNGGAVERVDDILIDPETWQIEQFIFRKGLPKLGKAFCVARDKLIRYDRQTRILHLDLSPAHALGVWELSA